MGTSKDALLEELERLKEEFEQYKKESVKWSIEDFMDRAESLEIEITPDKAQILLERMIDGHDASIGINWDTIDYYIENYEKEDC